MASNPPDPDKTLAQDLASWRLAPARSPQFRTEVWARIAQRSRSAGWPGYLRQHAAWVAGAFALALVLGAWTGRGQARARAAADRAALAAHYVQALDARTMRMP